MITVINKFDADAIREAKVYNELDVADLIKAYVTHGRHKGTPPNPSSCQIFVQGHQLEDKPPTWSSIILPNDAYGIDKIKIMCGKPIFKNDAAGFGDNLSEVFGLVLSLIYVMYDYNKFKKKHPNFNIYYTQDEVIDWLRLDNPELIIPMRYKNYIKELNELGIDFKFVKIFDINRNIYAKTANFYCIEALRRLKDGEHKLIM